MATKQIIVTNLEDVFGEPLKFRFPSADGEENQEVGPGLRDVLKLFIRNLVRFHNIATQGKTFMPMEWSERALEVAQAIRRSEKELADTIGLELQDYKWLLERVDQYGTAFLGTSATMFKRALEKQVEDSANGKKENA